MKVHQLAGPAPSVFARALADFEKPFTYPLGPGESFRISHGDDYTLFFRSQGEGSCFIAANENRIVGALGAAIRSLRFPDGGGRSVAYFGDLKISPECRGGRVLLKLARATEAWLRAKVDAGFGIVMGGTDHTPEAYTGRAGIPAFCELGRVAILRISTSPKLTKSDQAFLTNAEACLAAYHRLCL